MNAGILLLLVGAGSALLGFLALCFARREPWDVEETPERYRELKRAYERVLRTLKDLEFDAQVGTLSAAEHGELKAEYKGKAIALRRELERGRMAAVRRIARGESAAPGEDEAARLEALVARARARLEGEKVR